MSAARGDVGPTGVDGAAGSWERGTRGGARRAWWLLVGLAVVVLAAAIAGADLAVVSAPDEGELSVERGGDAELPAVPGPAPRPVRWHPPASGDWAVLPTAPIGWRSGHVVADLGGRVVVWGGWQQGRPLRNGALLDVTTGEWSRMPDAPASQRRHVPVAAGRTLLLLDDERPQAFSLRDGRWSELVPPPLAPGSLLTGVAAWTGRIAVAATVQADGAAGPLVAWDVAREAWTVLPAPPGRLDDDMAMAYDGRGLLLFGDGGSGFAHRLRLAPAGTPLLGATWEELPAPDVPAEELVTAGVRAVSSGTLREDPVYVWFAPRADGPTRQARLLAYRSAATGAGAWSQLPAPPRALTDPELVVVGNDVVALDSAGVAAHRPGASQVHELDVPDVAPLQQRDAAASRGMVVWWGGGAGDGAVWRPPDGEDLAVASSARAAGRRGAAAGCDYADVLTSFAWGRRAGGCDAT